MNEKIWLVLATVCVCVTGGTEDHNCFNTDPRFRGASAGNYRIKAVAPCFNAGVFQADWMHGGLRHKLVYRTGYARGSVAQTGGKFTDG